MPANEGGIATTTFDSLVNWSRKYSLFQYPFVTACCGMEYMAAACSHYDISRFGAEIPRFSPRQSDVMWVVGTITHKMAPIMKTIYDQMADPKWVVSFGACACTGGFYQNYSVLQGIDRVIPVDIYIAGCPPRPEAVLDALMVMQQNIQDGGPMANGENPTGIRFRDQKKAQLDHHLDIPLKEVLENPQNPKSNSLSRPGFTYSRDHLNLNPNLGYDSPKARREKAALKQTESS